MKLYVCGITPYDTTHLGHAFTYIQFDALIRYLHSKGRKVTYVQNITDIDDDILRKAKEEGRNWKELGQFWTKQFLMDLKNLNILLPDKMPKATDAIPKIIEINKVLEEKGQAYKKGENLYFRVLSFPNYGQLSRLSRKEMIRISGDRGGDPKDPNKEDPLDFILWQGMKEGEPFWESPWGKGRPGWHIECSAMIHKYLGEQIDIHGGGADLIFPHHESEIAQSESYTGKFPFVKQWMHTGMVRYKGEKMSKSLGNLVMIKDLLKIYSPNQIRYLLLSHHYSEEWEFNEEDLQSFQKTLEVKMIKKGDKKMFEKYMEEDLNINKALECAGEEELKILGFTL